MLNWLGWESLRLTQMLNEWKDAEQAQNCLKYKVASSNHIIMKSHCHCNTGKLA